MYELDKIKEMLKSGKKVYESDMARAVEAGGADDPVFQDVLVNAIDQLCAEGLYHNSRPTVRVVDDERFMDRVHRIVTRDQILKAIEYKIDKRGTKYVTRV